MLRVYPANFHEENGSFWVEFPDLEGCQTTGDSLEDVFELAQEVLGLYLASKIENNETIPSPSDIKDVAFDDGFLSYVATDVAQHMRDTAPVKKTLTIPKWLNIEAEKKHINFSSTLKAALLKEIEG